MRYSVIAVVAAAFVSISPAVGQALYSDSAHRFSLTVPRGWMAKSAEEIREFDEAIGERMGKRNFHFIGGFRREPEVEGSPYVLVQKTDVEMDGMTWEALEEELGASRLNRDVEAHIKKSLSEFVKSAKMDEPRIEREKGRAFLSMSLTGNAGEKLRGLSVMHFTKDGAVQLNFYAPDATFEKDIALFEPFLASFKLDPGQEFVPGKPRSAISRIGTKAAIGAGIGIVLAIGHWVTKKGKGK